MVCNIFILYVAVICAIENEWSSFLSPQQEPKVSTHFSRSRSLGALTSLSADTLPTYITDAARTRSMAIRWTSSHWHHCWTLGRRSQTFLWTESCLIYNTELFFLQKVNGAEREQGAGERKLDEEATNEIPGNEEDDRHPRKAAGPTQQLERAVRWKTAAPSVSPDQVRLIIIQLCHIWKSQPQLCHCKLSYDPLRHVVRPTNEGRETTGGSYETWRPELVNGLFCLNRWNRWVSPWAKTLHTWTRGVTFDFLIPRELQRHTQSRCTETSWRTPGWMSILSKWMERGSMERRPRPDLTTAQTGMTAALKMTFRAGMQSEEFLASSCSGTM